MVNPTFAEDQLPPSLFDIKTPAPVPANIVVAVDANAAIFPPYNPLFVSTHWAFIWNEQKRKVITAIPFREVGFIYFISNNSSG